MPNSTQTRTRRRTRRAGIAAAAAGLLLVAAGPTLGSDSIPEPAEPKPEIAAAPAYDGVGHAAAETALRDAVAVEWRAAAAYRTIVASVDAYVERAHVVDAARQIEAQRRAAEQAAAEQRSRESYTPPSSSGSGGGSGVGACTGFNVPDHVIARESGGDPTAANPSGAYGCTQIMPEWWSGHCSHLDRTTVDGQRACTDVVLELQGPSAWAATY